MASADSLIGLDLEDLTPRQLRQLLRKAAMRSASKDTDERDRDADKAAKDNDDLVDLQEEKKGKSKAPAVEADDLPPGIAESEEPDEERKPAKKKGRA